MRSPSSCKCFHCRKFFIPSPNNRRTQRYCSKPECRKASKAAAQTKWMHKPQNRSYFRGLENVARVRQWRQNHPGYWRKKAPASQDALKDLATIQVVQRKLRTVHKVCVPTADSGGNYPFSSENGGALQDFACVQVPLLAGVVSLLMGHGLQDRFEVFARQLVDRGKRVLETEWPRPLGGAGVKH